MTTRIVYQEVAPAGTKALGGVYGYVQNCGLPHDLIELVYLRISQINKCAFCIDMHGRALRQSGMTPEKIMLVAVWREARPLFNAREQAALAWAETVTRVAETEVPDPDYANARAVFAEKDLVDLTIAIGLMNAYNRLAISFRRSPATVDEAASHR